MVGFVPVHTGVLCTSVLVNKGSEKKTLVIPGLGQQSVSLSPLFFFFKLSKFPFYDICMIYLCFMI